MNKLLVFLVMVVCGATVSAPAFSHCGQCGVGSAAHGEKHSAKQCPAGCSKPCCAKAEKAEASVVVAEKSLYERLGGEAAIKAVVDDFVPRAAANPAVNFTRQGQPRTWEATPENVEKLKKHLVQFVSMATGASDAIYEGRDMVAAHQGLNITDAEFDALAADLAASCDKLGVPAKEKGELLTVAGSTRGSIVQA